MTLNRKCFPPSLNTQDGLYAGIARGYGQKGEFRNGTRLISGILKRGIRTVLKEELK